MQSISLDKNLLIPLIVAQTLPAVGEKLNFVILCQYRLLVMIQEGFDLSSSLLNTYLDFLLVGLIFAFYSSKIFC